MGYRLIGSSFAVILAAAGLMLSQTGPHNLEADSVESFKITPGTSFSASRSENALPRKPEISVSAKREMLLSEITEALSVIEKNHASFAGNSRGEITSSSIRAMLRTLDPHSNYFNPAEFAELLGEHRSEYIGTGSTIVSFRKDSRFETYVIATALGSASESAGLRFGDRIVSIGGTPTTGLSSYAVREMLRGAEGTSVSLSIERAGSRKNEDISLHRGAIRHPSVPSAFVSTDCVGFVDLSMGFGYTTVFELRTAIETLKAKGMSSLVLDLRGNGGGIVDQALQAAEIFLPLGSKILTQRGRLPGEDRSWHSQNRSAEDMPLVVLVDRDTASAAEILAGALQDNDRALIVGETTFGKGLVQNMLELPDGAGMTLTAARYYTPTGRTIQRDYSDIGLYDYYQHIDKGVLADRSAFVARTITGRRVYGGNGIEPDIDVKANIDEKRFPLLDPLFFFATEVVNGRISGIASPEELRQSVIFGRELAGASMVAAFTGYIEENDEWKRLAGLTALNKGFVASQLRYFISLGLFGSEIASRARISDDNAFTLAKSNLQAAKDLAVRAKTVREARRRK